MQAAAFSFRCRALAAAIHRTVGVSWQLKSRHGSNSFAFCSEATRDDSDLEDTELRSAEGPNCLSLRIERMPRGEPLGFVFQKWMGEGFPIHKGDIFHAINRLRKLKMNKRALEVMEWVIREKPYRPKELDYSYLLEFTVKLHGISQGAKVRLECRNLTGTEKLSYSAEAVTDKDGKYIVLVSGDYEDDNCEIVLVQSPMADCSEVPHDTYTRLAAKVSLTSNNGVVDTLRHANPLGFLRKTPLPECVEALKEIGLNY